MTIAEVIFECEIIKKQHILVTTEFLIILF